MYNFILFTFSKRNSNIYFRNSELAQTFCFGSQIKMVHKTKIINYDMDPSLVSNLKESLPAGGPT